MRIAAPQVVSGGAVTASIEVGFLTDVESIRLTVRGRRALESHPSVHVLRGPWAAGERHVLPWRITPARDGEGSFTATVEALDSAERLRFSRTGELFALVEQDRLWTNSSSLTDLQFRRIDELARLGTLSGEESGEMRLRVSTARVAADRGPRPPRALTAAELKLERAFPSAPGEPGPRTPRTESAVSITVHGQVQWTDRNGTRHGLPMAAVEIRDSEVIGSDLIQTVRTNAAGDYTATFTHDDGVLQGNPDIFVRVLAKSPVAEIKPDALLASTYTLESPVDDEVADGSNLTVNLTAGNVNDSETAFSIHHAMVVIGAYAGNLSGATPSTIVTRFPTTRETSMFSGGQLHILQQDRWDWDVLHHEYGHYVMAVHGFQNNPGGRHSFTENLAQSRGKDEGIRLAWGEGWPTFFALSGQRAMGAGALGVPDVGDVRYQDTEDASTNLDAESATGLGEDNEVSVIAALFDLYDGAPDGLDVLSLGDRTLFQAFKGSGATTAGAAWNAIAASNDTRTRTLIGGLLAQSKIAPELTQPADNVVLRASDPAPVFRWKRNGGGTPNPLNELKIVFYDEDFSSVLFEKELGDTDQFTPTAAELGTILGGSTPVKWLVEGRNTAAPATPGGSLSRYWSNARTIGGVSIAFVIDDTGSMSEEIDGVKAALQQFINAVAARVPAGTAPPTIQLISFKDSVTSRIVSNDLTAVRAAVSGLAAGGGGDCPEFSAHALQFAASNIAPGGTILLATDASPQPGVDLGATIAGLRAKGVTVNTILSGDCTGISSGAGLFDSSRQSQGANKPGGGDDPPQPPVVDPGQPPVDDHGDELSTATVLGAGEPAVSGIVGAESGDVDVFAFPLAASTPHSIDVQVDAGDDAAFELFDGEGTLVAQRSVDRGDVDRFVANPPAAGVYSLRVTTSSSTATRYQVAVRTDAFAALTSAVEVFSTVSGQTGGTFLIRDGVNSGDAELYESALFNVMVSTLGPAVLASEPTAVPAGATLSLNLRGRNTNWRANSAVQFSGTGLEVLAVTVRSATDLSVTVRALPGAPAGFRDVTVSTPLGGVETAQGQDVVEIVGAVASPTLLSVEPATISRGTTQNVRLRGVNTAWSASSTIAFGSGIEVLSSQTVSPTEITGQIRVGGGAGIGFRTAVVSTPSAGSQARTRAVFIDSGVIGVPVIESVSPDQGAPGATFVVTVEGTNTNFQAGVTTASFGAGITVLQTTVIDADTAQVTIAIDAGAAPGFRDVALTTGGEVAVLLQGFFVTAAPAATADVPTLPALGLLLLGAVLSACALLILRR